LGFPGADAVDEFDDASDWDLPGPELRLIGGGSGIGPIDEKGGGGIGKLGGGGIGAPIFPGSGGGGGPKRRQN
jgi:hypothetical protein